LIDFPPDKASEKVFHEELREVFTLEVLLYHHFNLSVNQVIEYA
jgi:hypothetical protein